METETFVARTSRPNTTAEWLRIGRVIRLFSLLVLLLPAAVQAEDYLWSDNGDGTCTITSYIGGGGEVVIPGQIDGLTVTSIGIWAFSGCTSLTSVTIPDSVTSIGYEAFYFCENLTTVVTGNGVTDIEYEIGRASCRERV